ncbi:hypothetical protein [Fervidibacillus albus]|uniref:Group-specific protein n=1 Tax=Fervidibacillus albus TaxID=2980026 RepID=A0A9E8LWX8_9BACI|nr:hypothetical protein [Fervidibacillus albus]WAA11076.1 hypothetical protein OE104_07175 [Fervidibacillus albus]
MFDPTAYENIKVVTEGLLYDYDLNGQMTVLERNDMVNLADLSRTFEMMFVLNQDEKQLLKCKVELSATFNQLAAEWILTNEQPGAQLAFHLILSERSNEILEKRMFKYVKQTFTPGFRHRWQRTETSEGKLTYEIFVEKIETVTENTVDELPSIMKTAVNSLQTLFDLFEK